MDRNGKVERVAFMGLTGSLQGTISIPSVVHGTKSFTYFIHTGEFICLCKIEVWTASVYK